jgi:hypothetical protein
MQLPQVELDRDPPPTHETVKSDDTTRGIVVKFDLTAIKLPLKYSRVLITPVPLGRFVFCTHVEPSDDVA